METSAIIHQKKFKMQRRGSKQLPTYHEQGKSLTGGLGMKYQ
jgi:hypothetical protein